MKKLILILTSLLLLTPMVGCQNTSSNASTSSATSSETMYSGDFTIRITAVGSATIAVSKTVQLRAIVSGTTQKDVTWTSLQPSIATVNERGLVTGVSKGKVRIEAALVVEPLCKETFEVTVEDAAKPSSIAIQGYSSTTAWAGENITLKAVVTPEDAVSTVQWTSSAAGVATVDATGKVQFLDKGTVTITAASSLDASIQAGVTFTVKKGDFLTNISSSKFLFDHQGDENPYIDMQAENSAGYNAAYFAEGKAERFYVETTIESHGITANAWAWHGFGLGIGLSDTDARFFTFAPFAPGQGNDHNKIILRDRPETWGALTTRSQVWGEHDLNKIDSAKPIKFGLLRYDNQYYYLINDEVYWYDVTEKYEGVATYPIVVAYDIPVKVSNYSVLTEEAALQQKLQSSTYKKSFFASNSDNVTYVDDANFTFLSTTTQTKDHKIRSLGDKAKLVRDFDVEFDVSKMKFNSERSSHTGLTINFTRYDSADVVDTISIGRSVEQNNDNALIARFSRWDYTQSFDSSGAIKDWFETTATVKQDPTTVSHVKITRRINAETEKAEFAIAVDGIDYPFTLGKSGAVNKATSTYTGAYLIWVGGEYASCQVSNFIFTSGI